MQLPGFMSILLETNCMGITSKADNPILLQQQTLRRLVGILGILLPILLYLYLRIAYGQVEELPSISHYFFTRASIFFIVIVSSLAIFLLIYQDKSPLDFYLSSAAGVFALCVLFFPTNNLVPDYGHPHPSYIITFLADKEPRKFFHFLSAAIFLGSLDAMSFFLFTRSDKPASQRSHNKRRRNRIFRTCSFFMTVALLVAFLCGFCGLFNADAWYEQHNMTFWMETVAIEAFGISWLIKGEVVLKG